MSLENANAAVMDWLDFTANSRIHQTTLQKPFDLLAEEQLALHPLPKPYCGVHPTKATGMSVSKNSQTTNRITIHIPNRDLQRYDEFIPAVAYLVVPVCAIGGTLWN